MKKFEEFYEVIAFDNYTKIEMKKMFDNANRANYFAKLMRNENTEVKIIKTTIFLI